MSLAQNLAALEASSYTRQKPWAHINGSAARLLEEREHIALHPSGRRRREIWLNDLHVQQKALRIANSSEVLLKVLLHQSLLH